MKAAIASSPRRLAVTVLALGAASATIMLGSYAAWTAQTTNPGNSVTAGTLTMTNNKDATAVFTATGAKPGDTGSSTVSVANSGSIPMTVKLTQDTVTDTGFGADLQLKIHDDTKNYCYWPTQAAGACGSYGAWDASGTLSAFSVAGTGGAQWAAAESHTFTVSWSFDSASGNSSQGKAASFQLVFDGEQ